MRISVIRNDPEQLQVKMTPKSSWLMVVFGFLFMVAGFATVWAFGCVSCITIDRSELRFDQLLLQRFPTQEVAIPIDRIREVNTKIYSYGISQSYEVNVVTRSGEFPMSVPSLDGDQKKELAKQIQEAILKGEEVNYQSSASLMWIGILLGICCVVAGLSCLYFLQTCSINANRKSNQIEIQCGRWLVPGIPRVESASITDITGVGDQEFEVGRGMPSPTASSKFVFLRTQKHHNIQLASGPMFTDNSARKIKLLLTTWLQGS